MQNEAPPIVFIKAPLAKLLRHPEHLDIYRQTIKLMKYLVKACYLFSRFTFIHTGFRGSTQGFTGILNRFVLSINIKITITSVSSNVESYLGQAMITAYLNNAQERTGQHFRTIINIFFGVRDLRGVVRSHSSSSTEKTLACAIYSALRPLNKLYQRLATTKTWKVESRILRI